jgi:hypothetical protein
MVGERLEFSGREPICCISLIISGHKRKLLSGMVFGGKGGGIGGGSSGYMGGTMGLVGCCGVYVGGTVGFVVPGNTFDGWVGGYDQEGNTLEGKYEENGGVPVL